MFKRGFTFIELMIVVFVIGILAAVGISKYQSFVIESRQKACMSQQKAIDQAYAVWETKNTPIPADDGAYQFIHPITGGPLESGDTQNSSHRFRWDPVAQDFVVHHGDTAEARAVLPSGSQLARLVSDEKVFCCTELAKRAGGAEFLPIPNLQGPLQDHPATMITSQDSVITYEFIKQPTVATSTPDTPGGDWITNAPMSSIHNSYIPYKVRRAVICRAYGKENAPSAITATGTVGAAFTVNTTSVPVETINFINGAGPDATRETLHQSWLLQ